MTRSLSLGISSESSFGGQTIQVNSSYNGTNYPSVINVGCGAYLSKADAFALFTLVLNSDGSATLYASGTVLATVANIWGPGVPIPPMTGNCTLTQFSGMGTSSWTAAYNQTFGQLELIAYTDAKPAAFVYTNAYAWGLV